jgi:spore maturation protein SpmB
LVGFLSVSFFQKINIFQKEIILTLLGLITFIGGLTWIFSTLSKEDMIIWSNFSAAFILLTIIVTFILTATIKKVNVYESFIEGAKDGFQVAIGIIPYLIAILVAIGMFRASGALDYLIDGIRFLFSLTGLDTSFVDALPTALMKPLSGSGARGMMLDAMKTFGPDSFVGRLTCIIQGSTETVFYILAVYYGAVGIKNTRYTLVCGLLADLAGVIAAITIAYFFFF